MDCQSVGEMSIAMVVPLLGGIFAGMFGAAFLMGMMELLFHRKMPEGSIPVCGLLLYGIILVVSWVKLLRRAKAKKITKTSSTEFFYFEILVLALMATLAYLMGRAGVGGKGKEIFYLIGSFFLGYIAIVYWSFILALRLRPDSKMVAGTIATVVTFFYYIWCVLQQ